MIRKEPPEKKEEPRTLEEIIVMMIPFKKITNPLKYGPARNFTKNNIFGFEPGTPTASGWFWELLSQPG
jgi:hypothetical protein